jgi:hypothetical protein
MTNKPININKPLTTLYFNNLILGELKKNGITSWIAGGALRDYYTDKPAKSDYDVYFPSQEDFDKAKNYFISNGGQISWESEHGMKVEYKGKVYDLVKIFSKNPLDTISKFDLTISQIATDGNDVYFGKDSLNHLQHRNLVIHNIASPFNTLKRTLKHYKKGYTMSLEEQKKLYDLLKSMPYDDTDDLLNASGSSGQGSAPRPTKTDKPITPVVEKPDYLKYALIGGAILVLGVYVVKKFKK